MSSSLVKGPGRNILVIEDNTHSSTHNYHPTTPRTRTVPPHSYPTRALEFLRNINTASTTSKISSPSDISLTCSLRILVVGAGLGGLATSIALALSNQNHHITVLEQSPVLSEVGAGIQLPSNITRLLIRWGVISHLEGYLIQPQDNWVRRWQDGSIVGRTPLNPNFEKTFGAPYYVIHRAHLHSGLHARAIELGVEVRVASKVVEYMEQDEAIVRLETGEIIMADLVIGADGIKSLAREFVTGRKGIERPTGYAAYRATVDYEKMKEKGLDSLLREAPGLNLW